MGRIEFLAPLESSGTGAILVGASIHAVAEAAYDTDSVHSGIVFSTGQSAAATEKMRLTNTGRVGIGTADPGSLLHLHSTGTPILEMKTTGTVDREYQLQVVHGDGRFSIRDETGSANRFCILIDGKVGIGTHVPAALLDVAGAVFPAADNTHDLGSAAKRWQNVYTTDLHLSNDRGDWTVIEEEDYLTLRNNKTDKIFKLVMEEIE